jgi:hypothetical protein
MMSRIGLEPFLFIINHLVIVVMGGLVRDADKVKK